MRHTNHQRLVHIQEGLVQRVQEAVIRLVAAADGTAVTCSAGTHSLNGGICNNAAAALASMDALQLHH
jgi:hypothetical protein